MKGNPMSVQQESALAAPSVLVTGAHLFGVEIHNLVLIATLTYTTILIAHKLWRIYKEITEPKYGRRESDKDEE